MFDTIYSWWTATENGFKQLPMYHNMAATVEGSPWHREANVAVHTEMVVGEFLQFAKTASYNDRYKALGLLATMFHDVGKPASKVRKFREDRGHYYAFHGHEWVSAIMFLTAARDGTLPIELSQKEMYLVAWMIQNHMPWETSDPVKLMALKETATYFGALDLYCDVLMADQRGRIADDQDAKNARASEWVRTLRILNVHKPLRKEATDTSPRLFMLIGASGAGKSTWVNSFPDHATDHLPLTVVSLDSLRLRLYNEHDYADAWMKSTKDKKFSAKAAADFAAALASGGSIVVDNTNMTRKSRASYVSVARQRPTKVVAVWFSTPLQTSIDRQRRRGDKNVPVEAVVRQFNSIQLPMVGPHGEVDDLIFV